MARKWLHITSPLFITFEKKIPPKHKSIIVLLGHAASAIAGDGLFLSQTAPALRQLERQAHVIEQRPF